MSHPKRMGHLVLNVKNVEEGLAIMSDETRENKSLVFAYADPELYSG